ncbi:pyruvate, water dikinase regulatory protein [Saccharicrinis aurantiacus]|uniref:pyruvate, water dikinase regulatory protein n=1 Tax=Saccharicrinis aurantiacus TaxID=1849719 RepID=UPI00248FB1C2|nr:pyruvate, water dikinase regulatory protein [Saccharicrinis aurantiacus]
MEQESNVPPIYIVSGGKGVAGHTLVESMLIQYPDHKIPVMIEPEVATQERIDEIIKKVLKTNGVIAHTMIDVKVRRWLIDSCESNDIRHFDLVGNMTDYLDSVHDLKPTAQAGLYRMRDMEYYRRVRAIEFTMQHDDGMHNDKIATADIVLAGVSRTGKTPLSIYLAMFGWKVANVPIVPGTPIPQTLFEIDPNRVFGLTISMTYLIAQRSSRVTRINMNPNTDYVEPRKVRMELDYAANLFKKGGFKVLNITNKPIEYSANEIITILTSRFGSDKWSNEEH